MMSFLDRSFVGLFSKHTSKLFLFVLLRRKQSQSNWHFLAKKSCIYGTASLQRVQSDSLALSVLSGAQPAGANGVKPPPIVMQFFLKKDDEYICFVCRAC